MIEIPPNRLADEILVSIIEEFINREGTDYGKQEVKLDVQIKRARSKIMRGDVLIMFDPKTESCNLITKEELSSIKKLAN
jgi:uncharacterized protein YheU (UPF0270 family)